VARRATNNPRQIRSKTCGCPVCVEEFPPAEHGERKKRRDCLGSWQARYRDPAGKQKAKHFPTKREADAFLDSVRTAVRSRSYHDPKRGEITLEQWWDLWWPNQGGEQGTRNRKYWSWTGHISKRWADTPLNGLEYMALQGWIARDVKGHETQRKVIELLRTMLRDAVRDGQRIMVNPAAELHITATKPAKHPDDLKPPTEAQYAAIREALPVWYRVLADFAQDTGMRWGEYVALRRCSVDTDAGLVYVREVIIDDRGTPRRKAIPKSAAGLRMVPLTPKALDAVQVMIERLDPSSNRSAIEDGMCSDELVFRGPLTGTLRRQPDGTRAEVSVPLRGNNIHRVWVKAIQEAGIAREIKNPETGRTEWWPRVHDYRHAVASRLHEAGVPEVDVQAFLGQERGSRVTWLYTHTSDEALGTVRDVLAGAPRLRVVPPKGGKGARVHKESTSPARKIAKVLGDPPVAEVRTV
jgi:integrase